PADLVDVDVAIEPPGVQERLDTPEGLGVELVEPLQQLANGRVGRVDGRLGRAGAPVDVPGIDRRAGPALVGTRRRGEALAVRHPLGPGEPTWEPAGEDRVRVRDRSEPLKDRRVETEFSDDLFEGFLLVRSEQHTSELQ